MQLGIGTVALGTAYLLRQRLMAGLLVGAAGGWLLWVVRPHLLALVTVAAGCAYVVGRVRSGEQGPGGLLSRPVGLLVVVLLMVFTVSQGTKFLGIDELSLSSIEAELDEQTERSCPGRVGVRTRRELAQPAQAARGSRHRAPAPLPVGDRQRSAAAGVARVGAPRRPDRRSSARRCARRSGALGRPRSCSTAGS